MKTPFTKANETLAVIVGAALDIAKGIGHVSFGKVAKRMGMSKSGVFCRTGSQQDLPEAVLDEYDRRFVAEVVAPARNIPKGLPALRCTSGASMAWRAGVRCCATRSSSASCGPIPTANN